MTIPDAGHMINNRAISIPITPDEEKRIFTELTKQADSNLKEGNLYYVVSNRWITSWYNYTKHDVASHLFDDNSTDIQSLASPKASERPGPIDNSDIVLKGTGTESDDLELSRTLQEGPDYILVPEQVWERLTEWYGGGPAIPRRLISQGDINKQQFNVEVFPLCFKLLDSRDNTQSIIRLSRKASLHELYEKVCKLRQVEPERARIWDYFNQQKHAILEDESNKTIEKSELQMDQHILLEVEADGIWPSRVSMDSTGNELALVPMDPPKSSFTIAGGPSISNGHSSSNGSRFGQGSLFGSRSADMEDGYGSGSKSIAKSEQKGLAGLQNLGNTCFMNSALQCLVHTPPIVEYFLQDYSDEINKQNPLGLRGELATAFGELLRKLWASGRTAVAPRPFKGKLGRFAPQFSGYNQHDSQELLAFLLDGLHEDLNRVKQKPYFEAKDSDGRPDKEVADECWRNHKARNDSIIVDVCQGQYKSTLVCPVCSKISITFDPFMYLSLPLPSTVTRTITVTVFYGDGSCLPMPYTVKVLKHGACRDLTQALASACCLRIDENLVLAEVYQHKIYRYLESPLEPLSTIKDDEHIVAVRVPKKRGELTRLEISHRYQENCLSDNLKGCEWKLFLTPLVTYVEMPQTRADIELAVKRVMLPLMRENLLSSIKLLDEDKEKTGSEAVAMEESANIGGPSHALSGNDLDGVEMEEGTLVSRESAFQLCLTDDRGSNCRPILKDSKIPPHLLVKVTLDWTSKEFDLYDSSYLKDLPEAHKSGISAKKTKQEAISLFSCLDAFLKEEPLGPDDMWYCPGCKAHRQATKKLDLWRLPEILVFHLKRFSYSRYMKNKLEAFVNFDIHNLDLSKYVKYKDATGQSQVYELYAISNHYGGLGGGHYTAYAKLIEENRWYHFDDAHVTPVNETDIKTPAAYLLFYQRVQTTAAAALREPFKSAMP